MYKGSLENFSGISWLEITENCRKNIGSIKICRKIFWIEYMLIKLLFHVKDCALISLGHYNVVVYTRSKQNAQCIMVKIKYTFCWILKLNTSAGCCVISPSNWTIKCWSMRSLCSTARMRMEAPAFITSSTPPQWRFTQKSLTCVSSVRGPGLTCWGSVWRRLPHSIPRTTRASRGLVTLCPVLTWSAPTVVRERVNTWWTSSPRCVATSWITTSWSGHRPLGHWYKPGH